MPELLLPDVDALRRRCIALAILEAAFQDEWEFRYFLFDKSWDADEQMASMRGDDEGFFVVFRGAEAFCKFYSASIPEVDAPAPPDIISEFVNEPAFQVSEKATYAWKLNTAKGWSYSAPLSNIGPTRFIIGNPKIYHEFACEYHEESINGDLIAAFLQRPDIDLLIEGLLPNLERSTTEFLDEVYSTIL